jgi:tRNA wybutosine-synthesizing protein 1
MHVGMSTKRLEASQMLEMEEIRQYANALSSLIPRFTIMVKANISIVVLQNSHRFVDRWIQDTKKLNVRSFQSVNNILVCHELRSRR